MAASGVGVLSEREEKQMSKLRERLFESNWDSAEFKASLRDLVSYAPVQMYLISECSAISIVWPCYEHSELDRCLAAG